MPGLQLWLPCALTPVSPKLNSPSITTAYRLVGFRVSPWADRVRLMVPN
jgi:hypothetical protein